MPLFGFFILQKIIKYFSIQNFNLSSDEVAAATEMIVLNEFTRELTKESQLKLGKLFLLFSEVQKMDQREMIKLLFGRSDQPIQRILYVLSKN